MSIRRKGLLLSYLGFWVAIIIAVILLFIGILLISHAAKNSCPAYNCDIADYFATGIANVFLLIFILIAVAIVFYVFVLPMSIYWLLRIGDLRVRALRTGIYTSLLLVPLWFIEGFLVSMTSQRSILTQQIVVISGAVIWIHLAIYFARRLALSGNSPELPK
jgi:hypothetical protein